MKMIKKLVLVLVFMFLTGQAFSQNRDPSPKGIKDSVNIVKSAAAFVADKLTIARPLNIEYSSTAPFRFKSNRDHTSLPESKVNNFTQVKVSTNFKFVQRKNWTLGASLGYRYTHVEADMIDPFTGSATTLDKDFHYFSSSLNLTYFSTLFKKRTIYSSSIAIDGSDQHLERLKGLITGVIVLKADQKTKLTTGIAVNIDPSAQLPVIPIFTYEYKFNNGLIVDITVPKSAYLRKYLFSKTGRASIGIDLDRTSFYLYHIDGTSQKYEYRQTDINPGAMYEQAIGNFVVTGKTGIKMTRASRVFRKQDSFKDGIFETEPNPTFYFNIGVSFNPFTLLKKKK